MTIQKQITVKKNLVYPELSYKIIGILYGVYNEVGGGFREKYYQKAISEALRLAKVSYAEQIYVPLLFKAKKIGFYYLDFLIENKIILEIKAGELFNRRNIKQVISYLKGAKLKLGILANFTKSGVCYKRILNLY